MGGFHPFSAPGPYEATSYHSAAAEETKVLKATPGVLYVLDVANVGAVNTYVQIHNTTAVPSAAAVPFYPPVLLAPGDTMSLERLLHCTAGITVVCSSTAATYTAAAANNLMMHAESQ